MKIAALTFFALFAVYFSVESTTAQPVEKIWRIGYLHPGSDRKVSYIGALHRQLRRLGYIENRDYVFEPKWARGQVGILPRLAADLVRQNVSVIVVHGTPAAKAAKLATNQIPIVMAVGGNPVLSGLVADLANPGGNFTGVTTLGGQLVSKRLQLLKETVPSISLVGVLADDASPTFTLKFVETENATRSLGISLKLYRVNGQNQYVTAFGAMARDQVTGLLVMPSGTLLSRRVQIADLALQNRLPTVYGQLAHVKAGGLIAYATSYSKLYEAAARYIDKIFKGANPGDLPIEQPKEFDLAVNLRTAKALGIRIPKSVLVRANEVIE